MRVLLCLTALVAAAFASRHEMLENNRIPVEAAVEYSDTCGECKSVVKSFVEAIDDPKKLAELKIVLSALCHETSYVEECKMVVAKLDIIIKKLEPYLRDYEAVCKKIHLCGNAKLTAFHRIGLLYLQQGMSRVDGVKDFVCDECQVAAAEVKKAIDDEKYRKEVHDFISENVCKRIPKYQGACDLMIEQFLPELFQELDALLSNPKQACAQLGFCAKTSTARANKQVSPKKTLHGFWKRGKYLAGPKGTVLLSCFECKVIFDGIIADLSTPESDQNLSNKLRDDACPQLPANMYDGCLDFINMYGPTVVHMTVRQFDSEAICKDLQTCDTASLASVRAMSKVQVEGLKCEACKAFSSFLEYEMKQPDFKSDLVAGIKNHGCSRLKGGFADLCENLMENYIPVVVDKAVAKLAPQAQLCEKVIHVC